MEAQSETFRRLGTSGNKVVATLRADGSVRPADGFTGKLATLMNYKIRTEADMGAKSLNTLGAATTIVDLGKQLLQYARDSDVKGVKNMLSRGAPFTSDWLGMSALHFAAMNNQLEICEVLLKGGINKDSKTKVDRTSLHLACYYGNESIVELLLSRNCAVNPRDMLRMTPLHWAVAKHHKNVVRMLLAHNADVVPVSKFGKTPIALAVLTEQADLLEELEAAKQLQASRKQNDEVEKETSDAVNSIMDLRDDNSEEQENARKIDAASEEETTNMSDYADAKMADFENIKDTGILDKSAINLLKSHGITMMQDDEEDTSKDLLTTALQNGRQLVLSEGGKLLLNEAKRMQNIISNNNNNNSIDNSNSHNTIVPLRLKCGDIFPQTTANVTPLLNKTRNNVITKAKDGAALSKNKNIRIISLNDFKRLYGNSSLKAIQKLPAPISNSQVVQPFTEEEIVPITRKTYNVLTEGVQSRQSKTNPSEAKKTSTPTTIALDNIPFKEEEANSLLDIIEIEPTDSEAEAADVEHVIQTITAIDTTPLTALPISRPQPASVKPQRVQTTTIKSSSSSSSSSLGKTANVLEAKQSTVVPLLTLPEICRQLFELRKQNEELRRKFDFAQKEKEEMRHRLERLEELLLVEHADDDYVEP